MLKLSIHAGPAKGISRYNRTDWLDIGYSKLGALADYKVALFSVGRGMSPSLTLKEYPRWSASLWDLVARSIALAHSDPKAPVEELGPAQFIEKRYAFADEITAVLQYLPAQGTRARELGMLQVKKYKGAPGVYRATLHEDLGPSLSAMPFVFRPKYLWPAELVCRAIAAAFTGRTEALPPRPALSLPKPVMLDGAPHLLIHRLREPARSGLLRWLQRQGETPKAVPGASQGAIAEARFLHFLETAL
jgi:hypothetical protein